DSEPVPANRQAECCADSSEHGGFAHDHTGDLASCCPERTAYRELPFPLLELAEHQSGNVRAEDEEQRGDGAKQQRERPRVRPGLSITVVVQEDRPALVGSWVLFAQPGRKRAHRRTRLL